MPFTEEDCNNGFTKGGKSILSSVRRIKCTRILLVVTPWDRFFDGKKSAKFMAPTGLLWLSPYLAYEHRRQEINIFIVLYGCETWSLTLREGRKLRVFENMVLRRIFGPRRDEVTGECRRLHNEVLNDLYSSPNIVRVIKSRRM